MSPTAPGTGQDADLFAAAQGVLDASAAGWNEGDLDAVMATYLGSEAISYVSGETVIEGVEAIRAMYARRFGSGGGPGALGRLELQARIVRALGPDHLYCVGRYVLERPGNQGLISGPTTLVMQRQDGGWLICEDHSA